MTLQQDNMSYPCRGLPLFVLRLSSTLVDALWKLIYFNICKPEWKFMDLLVGLARTVNTVFMSSPRPQDLCCMSGFE